MTKTTKITFLLVSLLFGGGHSAVLAQQGSPQNGPTPDEDVVRVSTSLVQTDVMVFDKQGQFVEGLKPEQFVLKVDGKPQPIAFFDRVVAGSANEEAQLAAARGVPLANGKAPVSIAPLDRGRKIVFYVDDLHMSAEDMVRVRKALLRYIEAEMKQNDQAVISSATGSIGFLQQFTNDKAVLKRAVEKLTYRPYHVSDNDRPPMSEFQALNVDRRDPDTLGYFVDEILKDFPLMQRETAESMVLSRAHLILEQAQHITRNTLLTMISLVKSLDEMPGRKLLFIASDGFFLDVRNSDVLEQLHQIIDRSRRANTVIYSIDARGLVTGLPDASMDPAFDPSGRLARAGAGEISASQDGLNALAVDTGGKALRNSNDLSGQISNSLKETSSYYLVAWKPETVDQKKPKFKKIEVGIPDRPELSVKVRRGFISTGPETDVAAKRAGETKKPLTVNDELSKAIVSKTPRTALPIALTANYLDLPDKGAQIASTIEIDPLTITFKSVSDSEVGEVDLAGLILDERGSQVGSVRDHLRVAAKSKEVVDAAHHKILYSFQRPVKPGVYQVRVAVRDADSSNTGTASEWIIVPDLSAKELTLSSLLVAQRIAGPETKSSHMPDSDASPFDPTQVTMTRRFTRNSFLRYLAFIYNASNANSPAAADLVIQTQVFRDDQPVFTSPLKKVSTDGVVDSSRLPYAAEISLAGMPSGQYNLKITVIDRRSKKSATQQTPFAIE
jgi:VWFA-related protein